MDLGRHAEPPVSEVGVFDQSDKCRSGLLCGFSFSNLKEPDNNKDMKLRLQQSPLFVRYLVYALLLGFGGVVTTESPAQAASPSGAWTVVDAYSNGSGNAVQIIGRPITLTFELSNADGTTLTVISNGVGSITSETSTAGFGVATNVSPSGFRTTSTPGTSNIETITVNSNTLGNQSLIVLDSNGASLSSIGITWINPTGISIDYKVGGVNLPGYIQYMLTNNGIGLNQGTDYSVLASGGGRYLIDVKPGTYFVKIYSSDALTGAMTAPCTVTAGSVTDCSILIPKDNVPFQILDSNDSILKSSDGVMAYGEKIASNKVDGFGFWFSNAQIDATALSIQDGSYVIHAFRNKVAASSWDGNDFYVTVAAGVVKSFVAASSGSEIPSGSNGYPLKFLANNFDALGTAGGSALANAYAYVYTNDPVTGAGSCCKNLSTDSSGGIHRRLANGINTIYVYNNNAATSNKFINTFFKATVVNGVITSFKDSQNKDVVPVSGVYPLALVEANVQGNFTVGGVAQQGYISQVFDLATLRTVSFEASYIDASGNFGLRLPAGNYRIVLTPYNSPAIATTCEVAATGTSTCNVQTPAANLKLEVDDTTGAPILDRATGQISLVDANFGRTDGISINSQKNLFYLADGDYTITVNSNTPAVDGQTRTFKFTVASGVVSDFTDTLSNVVLKANASGVYQMKLLAPNFSAIVNANGSPDPSVWSYANQVQNNYYRYATADANGLLKYNLPDGLNILRINPTGIETPTVVAGVYAIQVTSGVVTSVSKDSGETITANTDGVYTLDLRVPNIIGTVSVGGVPSTAGIYAAWNTVLNKPVDFNTSGVDPSGKFGILVPAGNYDFMFTPSANGNVGSVQNCTAVAGVQTRCDVAFPANNLLINVVNGSGAPLNSTVSAYVTRQNIGGQSFPGWWNFNLQKNANGQLQTSLLDGKYVLNISSTDPVNDGSARVLNFTVASGAVTSIVDPANNDSFTATANTFTIPLLTPNFKATILANGAADKFVQWNSWCQNNSGKTITNCWSNGSSDANGNIAAHFDNGTYYLQLNPTGLENPSAVVEIFVITVVDGVVTSVVNNFSGANTTATNGFYQLALESPNVTGKITVAGSSALGKIYSINNVFSVTDQKWVNFQRTTNNWFQGSYGLLINKPGSYLISVNEPNRVGVFIPCTVAATGTSECNLDIPADNLTFKVQGTDGVDLAQNIGAIVNINFANSGAGYWLGMSVNGQFSLPVNLPTGVSGSYTITVFPTDGSSRHGVSTSYLVDLNSDGTLIKQITNLSVPNLPALTPDPTTHLYTFTLTGPNLAGTVVAPDGTTPIPNTYVQGMGPTWIGAGTDSSGAFATRTNMDGTYQIWAQAPTYDMTKADSARQTVTVSGGAGNTSMVLTLRTPDVVGTIKGPTGIVSTNNYIQILKDDGFGNYNYVGQDVVSPRQTDTAGKFAFYLSPGNYKFQAQADLLNAGGSATTSPICVVPTPAGDPKDCSFNLNGINTKLQILGHDGKAFQSAYIYYNFAGDWNDLATRPSKLWDYSYLDANGQTKTFLENGEWDVNIQVNGGISEASTTLRLTIAGGIVTKVVDAQGQTLTSDAQGNIQVQLPTSNLLGSILENSKQVNYGASVSILKDQGDYYQYVSSQWTNNGHFAFLQIPGSYVVQVNPYPNNAYSAGSPVTTNNYSCVVPETGTVNCDVNLKSGNFLGQITAGGKTSTDSYAYIYNVGADQSKKNAKYVNTQIMMYGGQFSAGLEQGTYQLVVQPNWNSSGGYTQKVYTVSVTDTITVTDQQGGASILPDSATGRFSLPLSKASVSGHVYTSQGSSVAVQWANVHPINRSTGEELWNYNVGTNNNGIFSLTLPAGDYDLVANTWGGNAGVGSSRSVPQEIVIGSDGTLVGGATSVDLYMQSPNLSLRVVTPNGSTGVPNAWVSGVYKNSYFGGVTDQLGNLSVYVDSSTVGTCGANLNCQITVYPNGNSNYTPMTYSISNIGDIGTFAVGQISNKLTVRVPTNGDTGIPDAWAWVNVNEINESGTVTSSVGYGTDKLGQVGLGLQSGHHYLITAYPSGEYYGRYSPKTLEILAADTTISTNAPLTITFDSPNITFIAVDRNGNGNAWGWYEIIDSATATSVFTGYLNDQGRGAVKLLDGDYRAIFYPGKASGVTQTATFTVTAGHIATSPAATRITFTNDVGRIVLASGNISGTVTSNSGALLGAIPIIAVGSLSISDTSTVSTSTKSDGTYELNLDSARTWTITAVDPLSLAQQVISNVHPSSAVLVEDIKFA